MLCFPSSHKFSCDSSSVVKCSNGMNGMSPKHHWVACAGCSLSWLLSLLQVPFMDSRGKACDPKDENEKMLQCDVPAWTRGRPAMKLQPEMKKLTNSSLSQGWSWKALEKQNLLNKQRDKRYFSLSTLLRMRNYLRSGSMLLSQWLQMVCPVVQRPVKS